jgi:hypothetical protein
VSKAERYREAANRYGELAKHAEPSYLEEVYRKIAVRYVFMAEDVLRLQRRRGELHLARWGKCRTPPSPAMLRSRWGTVAYRIPLCRDVTLFSSPLPQLWPTGAGCATSSAACARPTTLSIRLPQ